MVTGSGPSFITESLIPSCESTARSMRSFSTGGRPSGRRRSEGFSVTSAAISPARSTSGTSATTHVLRVTPRSFRLEHPHPAEFRELALMRVEHERAGVAEPRFENGALALAEHHGVGALRGRQRRAGPEHVEEHAVQVEAVDQIEF